MPKPLIMKTWRPGWGCDKLLNGAVTSDARDKLTTQLATSGSDREGRESESVPLLAGRRSASQSLPWLNTLGATSRSCFFHGLILLRQASNSSATSFAVFPACNGQVFLDGFQCKLSFEFLRKSPASPDHRQGFTLDPFSQSPGFHFIILSRFWGPLYLNMDLLNEAELPVYREVERTKLPFNHGDTAHKSAKDS